MMSFETFAFCDRGANLTLQYLVANGYRPAIDFGYHYGLLPILVAHFWFAIFGAGPWAYQLTMLTLNILCAWAVAKTLAVLKVRTVGCALAILALGFAFQTSYPNLAQALEAAILCVAIAEQAQGSRTKALAIAAVAIFAKPSMGYVYGLLLITLIVRDLIHSGFSLGRLLTALAPAAGVFLSLMIVLSLTYGSPVFFRTVIPIEGATAYRSLNFGLMASGREFWAPKGLPWFHYFIDPSGLWIASSVFLFGLAILQLHSAKSASGPRGEVILTCALLHLAFLLLFFGNQWSWIYYSYLLIIGCAIGVDLGAAYRRAGLALCALAILSSTSAAFWTQRLWRTSRPDSATGGLWVSADVGDEWRRVLATIHDKKTVLMSGMGAAELMFSGFEKPVGLFLVPGLETPGNVTRKLSQLSKADLVVVPILPSPCNGVAHAPEFTTVMKSFEPLWTGQHFQLLRRSGAR